MPEAKKKLRLRFEKNLAPGDYVVTTALLRDIQLCHPNKYVVDFETHIPAVYAYNPNVTRLSSSDPEVEHVTIGYYAGMRSSQLGNRHHFISWLHKEFTDKTGIEVDLTLPRPEIWLSEREMREPPIAGRYWLMFAGGKTDVTIKHWDFQRYQEVASELARHRIFCVQTGSAGRDHVHPSLKTHLNLVGWGYLRELFWQLYHAEGVICPITCGMHVAAAFQKPCVVISGGREEPWWEAYDNSWNQFGSKCAAVGVPHRYLHTIGQLACCQTAGCWKNKVVRVDNDRAVCVMPASRPAGAQVLPECMYRITVSDVVGAVLSYYREGLIPPPFSGTEPKLLADDVPWQPAASTRLVEAGKNSKVGQRRRGILAHNDKIGTKITVFAYLRGDFFSHHKKLLDSVIKTVPKLNLQLRVLATETSRATTEYAKNLSSALVVEYPAGTSKYQAMRQAFWDENYPIETRYIAWFDGRTRIAHDDWLNELCKTIIAQRADVGAYGVKQLVKLQDAGLQLAQFISRISSRPWYGNRPLGPGQGGSHGEYARGLADDFFVLRSDAIRKCDLPDEELITSEELAGELLLGEQLYQGGFKVMSFNVGRAFIHSPLAESN